MPEENAGQTVITAMNVTIGQTEFSTEFSQSQPLLNKRSRSGLRSRKKISNLDLTLYLRDLGAFELKGNSYTINLFPCVAADTGARGVDDR